mmetsp:Transcript_6343/g.19175  ORF Transcript_6343/g.19175 Transcript_6343/m.19175 type:complete len:154 (+) Transcript_6343:62-523(+)|eukprot:CAMPEP_0198734924 /NCGR_PEP_ID=MMETSP1475-20131203/56013_1 /TAXON_ID= ORGANISM="Unidentified sp., Strain CCMP1999" /NCGR_SAMPLE_ID=MMETSP1475 /ASSEMBLY_ACC=CAM_ASM_001111 /LENGTH=153 /DNA_ID=CAMNT_0044498491 /DNA_START=45 /DNA_END=506 /DNA_ORIENTATION=-
MELERNVDHSPDAGSDLRQVKRKEAHFRCPIVSCGRVFNRSYNFKAHMRLHNGDKPYKCHFENCSERFKWRSSLMNHTRRHAKEETKKALAPSDFIKSVGSAESNVSDGNEEESFYTEVRGTLHSSGELNDSVVEEYVVDDNVLFKCPIVRST